MEAANVHLNSINYEYFAFNHSPSKDPANKSWSYKESQKLSFLFPGHFTQFCPQWGVEPKDPGFFRQSLLDCLAYCPEQLLVNFSTFLPLKFSYTGVNRVDLFGSL